VAKSAEIPRYPSPGWVVCLTLLLQLVFPQIHGASALQRREHRVPFCPAAIFGLFLEFVFGQPSPPPLRRMLQLLCLKPTSEKCFLIPMAFHDFTSVLFAPFQLQPTRLKDLPYNKPFFPPFPLFQAHQ